MISYPSFLLPHSNLRVDSRISLLPLSFLCSGELAGRREDGVGGRALPVYSRLGFVARLLWLYASSWLYAVVAEGRVVDFGGQIRRAVSFSCLPALRRWQAVSQGWMMSSFIPPNKVRKGIWEWSCAGQARLCTELLFLVVVLLWMKTKAMVKQALGSFNKACKSAFCCCYSFFTLSPPACGGSMEFDGGVALQVRWLRAGNLILLMEEVISLSARCGSAGRKQIAGCVVDIKLPWSRDTTIWSTISAAVCSQPTMVAIWWPSSPMFGGDCSTSRRRPSAKFAAALYIFLESSGFVPDAEDDGRGSSSLFFVNGGGPNCFSHFLCRVFFVKARDLVVFSVFLKVPNVNCTRC